MYMYGGYLVLIIIIIRIRIRMIIIIRRMVYLQHIYRGMHYTRISLQMLEQNLQSICQGHSCIKNYIPFPCQLGECQT